MNLARGIVDSRDVSDPMDRELEMHCNVFFLTQLQRDGYVVLEDFLKPEEVDELKACGEEFTTNLPPEHKRKVFSTVDAQQVREWRSLEPYGVQLRTMGLNDFVFFFNLPRAKISTSWTAVTKSVTSSRRMLSRTMESSRFIPG